MKKTCKGCKANTGSFCGLGYKTDTIHSKHEFGKLIELKPLQECEKPKTLTNYLHLLKMKKLLILLIPILFACVKENNHGPMKERITGGPNNGYWSISKYVQNDSLYYDTLRLTENSSYIIFNHDGTGSVKFYSHYVFDGDFSYWTVEDDVIAIINGPLEGYWRIPENMKFINRVDDPQRRTFMFNQ